MNKERVNFIRDDLEFAALNYARLKAFRCYKEHKDDKDSVLLCQTDANDMMAHFDKKMKYCAEELLRELLSELTERKS